MGGLLPIPLNEINTIIGMLPQLLPQNTPANFGKSTMGREIMAARAGHPNGRKVLMYTQQHGNEPNSTEAALQLLKSCRGTNGIEQRCGKHYTFCSTRLHVARGCADSTRWCKSCGAIGILTEVMGGREFILYPTVISGVGTIYAQQGATFGNNMNGMITKLHLKVMLTELIAVADGLIDEQVDNGGFDTNPDWAAPNLEHFQISDQTFRAFIEIGVPASALENDPKSILVEIQQ